MAASFIQSNSAGILAAQNPTVAFGSNNAQGNLIIVAISYTTTVTVSSVTDSKGNTYTNAVSGAGTTQELDIWYAFNIGAGANTVTVNLNTVGGAGMIAIHEYAGLLSGATPIDKTASTSYIVSTAPNSGNTATTTQANELLFAAMSLAGSDTITAGSGYTLRVNQGVAQGIGTEDQNVSSTGAYAGTFSLNSTSTGGVAIVTFKAINPLTISVFDNEAPNLYEYIQFSNISWKSNIAAWIYPGAPACNANVEYSDGRKLFMLKPQYYSVTSGGAGTLTQNTTGSAGCNGFSSANAADVVAHCKLAFVTISCGSATDMDALTSNSTNVTNAINTLVSFCQTNSFAGVELDWEAWASWTSGQYTNYKSFVASLGSSLHANGLQLMITGPCITAASDPAYGQNLYQFKYEDFATTVDYVVPLVYDNQFNFGAGTSVSTVAMLQNATTWTTGKVPTAKVMIGMPSYGYHGVTSGFSITIDTKAQSAVDTGYTTATRNSDFEMNWTNAGSSFLFQDSSGMNSIRQTIEASGARAVSVWHLGGNDWFVGLEPNGTVVFDTVTETESVTMTLVSATPRTPSVFDAETATDVPAIALTDNITLNDSEVATDTPVYYVDQLYVLETITISIKEGISVFDSESVTDVLASTPPLVIKLPVSVSDNDSITESISFSSKTSLTINDAESATESINIIEVDTININDSDTITDVIIINDFEGGLSISDNETVTDAPTYYVDQLYVLETISISIKEGVNVFDAESATDSATLQLVSKISVFDAETVTDVPSFVEEVQDLSVFDSESVTDVLVHIQIADGLITFDSDTVTDTPVYYTDQLNVKDSSTVKVPFLGGITVFDYENEVLITGDILQESGGLILLEQGGVLQIEGGLVQTPIIDTPVYYVDQLYVLETVTLSLVYSVSVFDSEVVVDVPVYYVDQLYISEQVNLKVALPVSVFDNEVVVDIIPTPFKISLAFFVSDNETITEHITISEFVEDPVFVFDVVNVTENVQITFLKTIGVFTIISVYGSQNKLYHPVIGQQYPIPYRLNQ